MSMVSSADSVPRDQRHETHSRKKLNGGWTPPASAGEVHFEVVRDSGMGGVPGCYNDTTNGHEQIGGPLTQYDVNFPLGVVRISGFSRPLRLEGTVDSMIQYLEEQQWPRISMTRTRHWD